MQALSASHILAPHIVDDRCVACPECPARQACRTRAILRLEPDEPPYVDASRCYGCRACVPACPFEAVAA